MPNEIRGVALSPPTREPRKLGRMEGPGQQAPETIQPGKYADGQDRHGINVANVHGTAAKQRYADGEAHRASERSQPYPK
jgi:hypothetical protein